MSEEITIKSCSIPCQIKSATPALFVGIVIGYIFRELDLFKFVRRLIYPEPKQ